MAMAMAAISHCCCFLTCSCYLSSSSLAKTQFSGKVASFLCEVENFGPSFKDVNGVVKIHHLLLEKGKQSLIHCRKSDGKLVLDRISLHCDEFLQQLTALERRGELQRLNEQLRQINAALRRQAKIESYAPSLSYASVVGRISENEVFVDPRKEELFSRLKSGKNFLRNQEPEKAFLEFKTALELAKSLKDPIKEKKAARGLGPSLQRQGKYQEAIKYHSMVLAISEREGEDLGNTEAYGAIADCYTELGDLEKAGKFYDKYIARLEKD